MKKIFVRNLYLASLFAAAVVVTVFAQGYHFAKAQVSASSLSGYAWSDNIGWISFSGTTPGSTGAYGVNEDSSGNLTGYAWSDNIGWIKFGGLNVNGITFPSGTGTSNVNAKINADGTLHGWARACAGTVNGDCASASRTDGWDGWISLDGTGYGVQFGVGNGQYSQANEYAWGSDVVGWISFNPTGLTSGNCNPAVEVCGGGTTVLTPSISFGISSGLTPGTSASIVEGGAPAALAWTTQNMSSCTESSSGTGTLGSDPNWPSSSLGFATSSGTRATSVGSITTGTETYYFSCVANSQTGTNAGKTFSATPVTLTVTAPVNNPPPPPPPSNGSCSPIPTNSSLCSGSALPVSGNSASSLVSSCNASGGTPICQYTCATGYHQVDNECVGNGTLQEK